MHFYNYQPNELTVVVALLRISRHHQNIKVTLILVTMRPRIAYLDIPYSACCYVASDILDMALVNLPINGYRYIH